MMRQYVARFGARPWATAAVLALAACQTTTVSNEPSPAYAMVSAQTQASTGQAAGCLDEAEHNAVRARILQNSLATATLTCLDAKRGRLLEVKYNQFVQRYNPEYAENARVLRQVAAKRGRNFDVMNTDMANQAANRMSTDPQFCNRSQRALDWALSPKVTSLSQVPPPDDYTGSIGLRICKARA
jgi:membrane-bound lytic murein transglycosylase B